MWAGWGVGMGALQNLMRGEGGGWGGGGLSQYMGELKPAFSKSR